VTFGTRVFVFIKNNPLSTGEVTRFCFELKSACLFRVSRSATKVSVFKAYSRKVARLFGNMRGTNQFDAMPRRCNKHCAVFLLQKMAGMMSFHDYRFRQKYTINCSIYWSGIF
jgi:hypothetical protein